jgi:Mg2+ and Co2+ transporter CorA
MNVPVPFADHPLAFTGIIVVTVALVAPIVVYFYRKNWL